MPKYVKEFIKEMILPTIVLVWATYYFFQIQDLGWKNNVLIKPVYFALVVLYVINAIIDFYDCRKTAHIASDKDEATADSKEQQDSKLLNNPALRIAIILAALAVFALLLNTLGFLISGYLFMAVVLYTMRVKKVLPYIVFPLVSVTFLYVLFKFALGIPLPAGFLGI